MKTALLAFISLALLVGSAAADTPAYRTSWTASGSDPTITFTPAVGDAIYVLAFVNGASSAPGIAPTMTDNQSGTYTNQNCGSVMKIGTKYAYLTAHARDALITSASSTTITLNTSGKNAVVIAVAVSGLTVWDSTPRINGCNSITQAPYNFPDGNVRLMRGMPWCINCNDVNPIVAGTTPQCPVIAAGNTFLSTSLTFAILVNQETSPGVTAPTNWTQRSTVSLTAGGKTIAMSLSTRDSGFSGSTITWGSTTPTDAAALTMEVRSIQ